jgi:hypothetical protein
LLVVSALISQVLPVAFYLLFLKRNRGEGLGVIFFYCCFSWVTEGYFLGFIFNHLHLRVPGYVVDSSFTILEFTIISWFAYISLQGKRLKYVPLVGALIFYPIAIVNFTGNQGSFDSIPASIEAIIIISYCILLLYEQINDPQVIFVYNTKKFWITIAFFLYFSSTLFLFLVARNFTQAEHDKYWTINNFFEILKNILISVSFIMKKSVKNPYPRDFDSENLNLNM